MRGLYEAPAPRRRPVRTCSHRSAVRGGAGRASGAGEGADWDDETVSQGVSNSAVAEGVEKVLMTKRKGVENLRRLIRDRRDYLNRYIAGSGLSNTIETIIEDLLSQPSVVLNLTSLQSKGDNLLSHAIAVTVTALCIARKYRFSYEEMKQLAMGSWHSPPSSCASPWLN